jgi:hypothetical protein
MRVAMMRQFLVDNKRWAISAACAVIPPFEEFKIQVMTSFRHEDHYQ